MAKLATHLVSSVLFTVISVVSLGLILAHFSPENRNISVLTSLYFSIFLAVFGITSIAGLGLRGLLWRTGMRHEYVGAANRQAVLFGIMTVTILMLEAGKVFNLWSAGLLLIIFILLELYVQ